MDYEKKYLKYKNKYLDLLKKQFGGSPDEFDNIDFFFNFNKVKDIFLDKYDFYDNNLILSPISRLGEPSENGFINQLIFKNKSDNKLFTTIMKTSIKKQADNNYYEFVVGNCINKLKKYFPNFIYTFKFMNLSYELKDGLKNDNFTDLKKFEDSESKQIEDDKLLSFNNIGNGCKNNDKSSILIEYVPNSLNLNELLNDSTFIKYKNVEIYNILFQVYALLSSLKKIYTHYDLHDGNIMYVKIPDNKIVSINYTINNNVYIIYTHFIPVIIDYGRSYINCLNIGETVDPSLINSKIYSEIVCENPNCNSSKLPGCNAIDVGLGIERNKFDNYSNFDYFYYIDMRHPNESSDLRFINVFMTKLENDLPIKINYESKFDGFWLSSDNRANHLDKTTSLLFNIKERPSNLNILRKISTTTDCIMWLISLYNETYTNENIINELKYGSMNIDTDIDKKIKWSFNPLII